MMGNKTVEGIPKRIQSQLRLSTPHPALSFV